MSRSYKKVWGFVDRNPIGKKFANQKVRRTWDVPNGKSYKKLYDSYNICDHMSLVLLLSDAEWMNKYYYDKYYKVYGK